MPSFSSVWGTFDVSSRANVRDWLVLIKVQHGFWNPNVNESNVCVDSEKKKENKKNTRHNRVGMTSDHCRPNRTNEVHDLCTV